MPLWYPPEKLSFYPHMAPGDISVWEKYLDQHSEDIVKVAYDVKVGQGSLPDTTLTPAFQKMQKDLSVKRIDAVILSPDGRAIITEIKVRAGLSAIGQVVSYEKLFNADYPDLSTRKMIVCDDADLDIHSVSKDFQIELVIV